MSESTDESRNAGALSIFRTMSCKYRASEAASAINKPAVANVSQGLTAASTSLTSEQERAAKSSVELGAIIMKSRAR